MLAQPNADIRTCYDNDANDSGFLESFRNWAPSKSLGEACLLTLRHKWVLAALSFLVIVTTAILPTNSRALFGICVPPTLRRKLCCSCWGFIDKNDWCWNKTDKCWTCCGKAGFNLHSKDQANDWADLLKEQNNEKFNDETVIVDGSNVRLAKEQDLGSAKRILDKHRRDDYRSIKRSGKVRNNVGCCCPCMKNIGKLIVCIPSLAYTAVGCTFCLMGGLCGVFPCDQCCECTEDGKCCEKMCSCKCGGYCDWCESGANYMKCTKKHVLGCDENGCLNCRD